MIQAHGAEYATKAEAEARIAELNELNMQLGASDGRVTEIQCIIEAVQKAGWEQTPLQASRPPRYAEPTKLDTHTAEQVRISEKRIREIEGGYPGRPDDGQWRYLKYQDDKERVTRREYKTELGFLRGFVKAARGGFDILIAE